MALQWLLRLSGAAFVNRKRSRTTGNIRSRANKQRCPERSAPLWFVLAIIVLSLRNAGWKDLLRDSKHTQCKREAKRCSLRAAQKAEITVNKPRERLRGSRRRPSLPSPKAEPSPGGCSCPAPLRPSCSPAPRAWQLVAPSGA